MLIFISYGPKAEPEAALVKRLIEAVGLDWIDAKGANREMRLRHSLRAPLNCADFLIAVCVEDDQIAALEDQLAQAKGRGIESIVITCSAPAAGCVPEGIPLFLFNDSIQESIPSIVRELLCWRLRSIFGVACGSSDECEESVSSEIFLKLSQLNLLDSTRHKRAFDYTVRLEDHADPALKEFYKATFFVRYHSRVSSSRLRVQSRSAQNNFHHVYNELVQDRDSVYRYVIKTPPGFCLNDSHFRVTEFRVGSTALASPSVLADDCQVTYTFEDSTLQDAVETGESKMFSLTIETIVRRDQNEFTMIFGYPVDGLNASVEYAGTDIRSLDVVDIFTSRADTVKSPLVRRGRQIGAQAKVVGWVLPESAVVFVWQRDIRHEAIVERQIVSGR